MQLLVVVKSRVFFRGSRCCFDDAAAGAGSLERASLLLCLPHSSALHVAESVVGA
jgi:hypothetical protein